jgi:alpha-tubulin suppressor-like RCC1 family protein
MIPVRGTLGVILLATALGCDEHSQSPTPTGAPDASLKAAAAALSFRQISVGVNHSCGTTTDDRAYCWGSNSGGTLGTGGPVDNPDGDFTTRPIAVRGGLRFRVVSVGTYHSCGLTTGDLAYCWGTNNLAQLGTGNRIWRSSPTAVVGGRRFRQLRVGDVHTCAVTYADVAFCWGDNTYGQLGDGTTHGPLRPIRVVGGLSLRRVFAGGSHTCGSAAGGKTYCWGRNTYGQLGDGTTIQRLTPVAVKGNLLFSQLTTGSLHSCGVSNGRAYCWGRNRWGQLGDGTMTRRVQPAAVAGGLRFAGVSTGNEYTCGITTASRAYCWGLNHSGRLGDGEANTVRLSPVAVQGGLLFSSIYASVVGRTTCGVTTGAKGYCWGDNFIGQVGDGSSQGGAHLTPTAVAAPM